MYKMILAAAAALLASAANADTLVHNVNGIQVGADGKVQRFRGFTIGDDGKVRQLLENPDLVRLSGITAQVDGGGRTLLPGIIDAHGHLLGLGFAALTLDLSGTKSLADLQQRLRDYAAANPDRKWIVGRGWNQELWADKDFPKAADLDSVVADRPVWLTRVDGHAAVGNSAALRAAGINAATASPTGGRIEKTAAGAPSGLFIDTAMDLVEKKIPSPTSAERDRALAEAQRLMLSKGVTAMADMGTSIEDWSALRRAGAAGKLNVRVMSYASALDPLTQMPRPTEWLYGERLRMGGVKIYSDGALGSRGAWLKAPYHDAPDSRGLRFLTDAELQAQVNQAGGKGFQVAVHAIGDAANDQVIRAFEKAGKIFPGDRRWRIEHFQVVDPTDLPRIARGGIIASMQPIHQVSDRLMAEKRLGPDRLDGSYAWQSVLRSGGLLAFGSDFPVEPVNPFLGLSAAVSRQDVEGEPSGGWLPEERLTFGQALHAFTRGGAYAGFAEEKIGSLEPGKWADFILVDRDPTAVDAQGLARTQVLETWVGGRKVWSAASVPAAPAN